MDSMTLECSLNMTTLDWIFERCKQYGLVTSEYLTNLVLRDKKEQEKIEETYRRKHEEESKRP